MAVRLSKKGIVVLVIGILLIVIPGIIFTVYMLNKSQVAPDDTEAAEGDPCVNDLGDPGIWCDGGSCPDGWTYGGGCWTGTSCADREVEACEGHHEPGGSGCTIPAGGNCCCDSYSGCGSGCKFSGTSCNPGQIAMCNNNQASCTSDLGACADCASSCPSAGGWTCPAGYHSVTGSGDFASSCGCTAPQVQVDFGSTCAACNNPLGCCACCEPDTPTETNQCDTGALDLPPANTTVRSGQQLRIEGWAGDSDGIDKSRIEVFIDGTKVGNATAVDACENNVRMDLCGQPDPVSWYYIWTVPTVTADTTYRISVRWYDSGGRTGSNCEKAVSVIASGDAPYCVVESTARCYIEDGLVKIDAGWDVEYSDFTLGGTDGGRVVVRIENMDDGAVWFDQEHDIWWSTSFPEFINTGMDPADASWTFVDKLLPNTTYNVGVAVNRPHETSSTDSLCIAPVIPVDCPDAPPPNPDWSIRKTGEPVCIEAKEVYGEIRYEITITNNSETTEVLDRLVDVLDIKVQEEWLVAGSINPSYGTVETSGGNVQIVWDFNETTGTFAPGQSKSFSYTLLVPAEFFGEFINTATAYPEEGEPFSATDIEFVTCDGPLPPTGIFDSALGRIGAGLLLISISGMYLMSDRVDNVLIKALSPRGRILRNREKFEKRVLKD